MKSASKVLQKGFTLVELLIVVIILALLAAIVVPQFASSTDDAKLSALDSTLSNVRSVVDLYYQQHGEYPGANTAVATCATGTAGTGTANTAQAFIDQLSMFTDADGGACSVKQGNFIYGPYTKKNTLPNNPITGDNTLNVVNTGDLLMTGSGTPAGWKYDTLIGKFIADDANYDDR